MKKIESSIFMGLAIFLLVGMLIGSSAHARELATIDELARQGMQVRMGELTGAGSKFALSKLAGLVLPEGVLMKEDCTGIVVKNLKDPKVSDIVKIKFNDHEIMASEFVGFVVH